MYHNEEKVSYQIPYTKQANKPASWLVPFKLQESVHLHYGKKK